MDPAASRTGLAIAMRAREGVLYTPSTLPLDRCINPYPLERNFRAHCSDLRQIVSLVYERYSLSDFATVYEIDFSPEASSKMKKVFYRASGDQMRFRRDMIACFLGFSPPNNSCIRDVVKVVESHRHLLIEYQI